MTTQRHRPLDDAGTLIAQGLIIEAVIDEGWLFGTADNLADQLGVCRAALTAALVELTRAGWVSIQVDTQSCLAVHWERRERRIPVAVDRRHTETKPKPQWDLHGWVAAGWHR